MNAALRRDADVILRSSLNAVLPDEAVRRALRDLRPGKGRVLLVAAGKAAWQMAHAAVEALGRVDGGVVVTKYGHVKGEIDGVACYEGGHPVPDENGLRGTAAALALTEALRADDTVLFLLSGGGSALFESPLVPAEEMADVTKQLLACGAESCRTSHISSFLRAQILWRSIPCASGSHRSRAGALPRTVRPRGSSASC